MNQIAHGHFRETYKNLFILGVANFGKLNYGPAHITFQNCIFQNKPRFGDRLPDSQLEFVDSSVQGDSNPKIPVPASTIANSLLDGQDVYLEGVRVEGILQFPPKWRRIHKRWHLVWPPTITGNLTLINDDLLDAVNLTSLVLTAGMSFNQCRLYAGLSASGTTFKHSLTFFRSQIDADVLVLGANLDMLTMQESQLASLDIEGVNVNNLSLSNVVLSPNKKDAAVRIQRSSFRDAYIALTSDKPLYVFDNDISHRLNISGSASELKVEGSTIGSFTIANFNVKHRISLRDSIYTRAWIDWGAINNYIDPDIPTLLRLEAAYKQNGYFGAADQVYYFRQHIQYQSASAVVRTWDYFLLGLSSGFGSRPERIIPYTLCVILLFSLLFSHPQALVAKQVSDKNFALLPFRRRFVEAWRFSLAWFFRFSSEWEPSQFFLRIQLTWSWSDHSKPLVFPFKAFWWAAFLEAWMSWFLLAIFLGTYTRLIFR